jgi:hypothetical protein
MLLYLIIASELLCLAACNDKFRKASGTKDFDLLNVVSNRALFSSEISMLAIQERYTTGSFGYETYVNNTCAGDFVYIYGYVLNECSSTSASTSLRYDWCGVGADGETTYFNMVRFNNEACAGAPSWNYTYPVSAGCDSANARKPLCVPETQGWVSYGLKQHST